MSHAEAMLKIRVKNNGVVFIPFWVLGKLKKARNCTDFVTKKGIGNYWVFIIVNSLRAVILV